MSTTEETLNCDTKNSKPNSNGERIKCSARKPVEEEDDDYDPLQIHKAMIDLRKNGMSFALSSNWISQVIIKILSSLDALKRMTKLELRWFILNSLTRWSNQKAKEVYDMKIPSNGSWPQQKKTISSTK